MSGWRQARPGEMRRLWPVVRSSRLAGSAAEFESAVALSPWSVRISDAGDALVLQRWRAHLDVLAIRGAWCPPLRLPWLVAEARAVARDHRFGRLISPLLAASALEAYRETGMKDVESIVALQSTPAAVAARTAATRSWHLRAAVYSDVPALVELDAASFEDFWRYGPAEFADALAAERAVVAEGESGEIVGYSSSSLIGSAYTIGRLAVAPSARRRGVAQALVHDAAVSAKAARGITLSLCTQENNAASRALYERCGFAEVDERYGIVGCDTGTDAL